MNFPFVIYVSYEKKRSDLRFVAHFHLAFKVQVVVGKKLEEPARSQYWYNNPSGLLNHDYISMNGRLWLRFDKANKATTSLKPWIECFVRWLGGVLSPRFIWTTTIIQS